MPNVICCISVIQYFAGVNEGTGLGIFGPYKNVEDAEKHLKELGWRQKRKDSLSWEIGESAGDGDAVLAIIEVTLCNPREMLPRKKDLPHNFSLRPVEKAQDDLIFDCVSLKNLRNWANLLLWEGLKKRQ